MLNNGITEHSVSPWVNEYTVKESYPLPYTKDVLYSLYGNKWITSPDLLKGY